MVCTASAGGNGAASDGRIRGLDGLRGLAALTVLGGHLSGGIVAVVSVYLFFVLSSFLLTSQFLAWRPGDFADPWRWAHYAQRRFFRIVPLFVVVVLLSAATTGTGAAWLGGEGLPLTVKPERVPSVLRLAEGPNVLWTVAVECKFYLVLPVAAWLIVALGGGRPVVALPLLAAAVVACRLVAEPSRHSVEVLPFLPIFLVGIGAAVVHARLSGGAWAGSPGARRGFEAAAWLAAAAWAVTTPMAQRILGVSLLSAESARHAHLFYAVVFAGLILGMVHGRGGMARLLEARAMRWLGAVSFSLYLWHIGPIRVFAAIDGLHPLVAGGLAIAASLAISAASYRWIEKPILRATRHWLEPRVAGAAMPRPASAA